MNSIRNLSTSTSQFGSSSYSTLDAGGGNRRRSRTADEMAFASSSLTSRTFSVGALGNTGDSGRRLGVWGGAHHSVAGEVMGSSSLQTDQSFSSWRPRLTIPNSFSTSDAPDKSILRPPSPKTPSPTSGSVFNRLRSATWDSSRGVGGSGPSDHLSSSNTLHYYDQSKATEMVFEDDEEDNDYLFLSASESKEPESEDMHDVEEQASLHSVHSVIQEENEHDLSTESESELASGEGKTKGIFRGVSPSATIPASPNRKGVSFGEELTGYAEKTAGHGDENYPSSLPALTADEMIAEDEEGSVEEDAALSPTMRSGEAYGHFQRQNKRPNLWAKLNGCISWRLIGSCIVRAAPCFWCTRNNFTRATDRQILLRLNVLCGFFCVVQIFAGTVGFIARAKGFVEGDHETSNPDEDKPLIALDFWSLESMVLLLSVMNFLLLVATILTHRAIRNVNLVGLVRYMWVLFWLLPLQTCCMIGLFDYNKVSNVTTKHQWDDPTMKVPRGLFCEAGTADNKCMVPILGGSKYKNEEEWCTQEFNATDCDAIRDEAQNIFNLALDIYYTINGVWALLLVVLMWVSLSLCQAIITMPIVERSKESNIPLWLTLPIMGCNAAGYVLLLSRTSIEDVVPNIKWVATFYFISGVLFTLAALLGIVLKFYKVRDGKQRRVKQGMVVVFISTIFLTILGCATIFIVSLMYSLSFVGPPEGSLQQIACALDRRGSCTGCSCTGLVDDVCLPCPEWKDEEVIAVLLTMTKQSATLAAFFLIYAIITLRFGFVLFQHVCRYQVEYV